jgi:uncharacterized surface protein with fasciclin (FAS1) repeats
MKVFKYKFLKTAALVLSAAFLFASCKDDNEVLPTETLDAKIAANADLSLFQAALVKTRLDVFTKGSGPFTIFAPNNAAFNAVGVNTAGDLNLIDSNTLVQVLTYHIQAGSRSFLEIPLGPNATMSTQGGQTQYASRVPGGNAYINGAQITTPNIRASNGYLHIINRVLAPAVLTPAQLFALDPNYARFNQALLKTATATTGNPSTFFAVPNAAMVAAGYDSTTIANATGATLTTLTNVMKYHVIPTRRIFASDFVAGPLKTLQGTNVTISTTGGLTVKGTNNPAPFTIIPTNLLATTGIIHSINGVLKP